jgi:D-alanyl-D-alanine carboxypeptidase
MTSTTLPPRSRQRIHPPRHAKALFSGALLATAVVTAGFGALAAAGWYDARPPAALPTCRFDDRPASHADYDDWAATLLDTAYTLGPDYVPPDLVLFESGSRDFQLREFVVADLQAMLAAAADDGLTISVSSAYRSYDDQARVLRKLTRRTGESAALLSVARPGHSEHQLGTAVDLDGGPDWLADNAWRFGFLASYPAGRSPEWTCYSSESWHYRYFGRGRAATIRASGLSPREWLWSHAEWGGLRGSNP